MASAAKIVPMNPPSAAKDSPLTPELREFIDAVIVPILLKEYMEEKNGMQKSVASKPPCAAHFPRNTDFIPRKKVTPW
ncbi:MAG: hypothetical protein WA817_24370 [Candidatus Acidiferrum sp.]